MHSIIMKLFGKEPHYWIFLLNPTIIFDPTQVIAVYCNEILSHYNLSNFTVPELKKKETLVKNHYVGINASDINFTAGRYAGDHKLPFDAGFEGMGEVKYILQQMSLFVEFLQYLIKGNNPDNHRIHVSDSGCR